MTQRTTTVANGNLSDKSVDVPPLTVLLPTFNRAETLQMVLHSLENQSLPRYQFEIVVVDDASNDNTELVLQRFAKDTKGPFKHVSLGTNSGPAAARNKAIEMACGDILVIIGDDINPPPSFLSQHLDFHTKRPDPLNALLGYVCWPSSPPPTPFMEWMESSESRFFFAFPKGQTIHKVPSSLFYTCNVSLKRSLIDLAGNFDESFDFASHEDIELGHRLGEVGMILHFDRSVVAHHHHLLSVTSAARRCYYMGYSAPIYWRKVVDCSSQIRKTLRKVLATLAVSTPVHWYWKKLLNSNSIEEAVRPWSWRMILSLSYWIGYSDSQKGTLCPPENNTPRLTQ